MNKNYLTENVKGGKGVGKAQNLKSTVCHKRYRGIFVSNVRLGVGSATNKPVGVNTSAGVLSGFELPASFLLEKRQININPIKKEKAQC